MVWNHSDSPELLVCVFNDDSLSDVGESGMGKRTLG